LNSKRAGEQGGLVFGRLAAVIVVMGLGACVLLAIRQVRIQASHELAETRRRIVQMDHELWRLRAEIAERITPDRIHRRSTETLALKSAVPTMWPTAMPTLMPIGPMLAELASQAGQEARAGRESRE
jgi:hypothetical protein